MQLTICLLTKGREKYLNQTLNSFEKLFKFDFISFLIFDNGSNSKCELILKEWSSTYLSRVKYIRVEQNESRFSKNWQTIKNNVDDWIIFPGDDDEFNWEIIEEWEKIVTKNPSIVAFAASADVIDEKSKRTGIALKPSINQNYEEILKVAKAIHAPPFHWPSLFFRASKISSQIPNSRFVCDWWIGINLLMVGEVFITDTPAIKYRRHSEQESFLAPLRRKNFEALIWIEDLVRSHDFDIWLKSLSDLEKFTFWKYLQKFRPIYNDEIFGNILLANLFYIIKKSLNNSNLIEEITQDFAIQNGVFLLASATKNLIKQSDVSIESSFANFSIVKNGDNCSKVNLAIGKINYRLESPKFAIYCKHASKLKNGIKIDCSKLKAGDIDFNLDFIITSLTNSLEKNGYFNFSITPNERLLVANFRRFKKILPSYFLKLNGKN